ncbi:hypothetical protein B0H13DRAFT_2340205 [Mycena leptocephala]|nr:hypothetical protein B0H13DRAFT_2340205 [Mycena leptocephala]
MRTSRAVRKGGDQEEDPKRRLLPHPLLTLIALASHRRLSHSKFLSLRLTPLYTSCIHRQDITSYPRRSPPSKCTRLPPVDDSSTPSLLSRVVSRHPSTCTRPRSLLFFAGGRHRPVCRSEPSQLEGAGEDIYCEREIPDVPSPARCGYVALVVVEDVEITARKRLHPGPMPVVPHLWSKTLPAVQNPDLGNVPLTLPASSAPPRPPSTPRQNAIWASATRASALI